MSPADIATKPLISVVVPTRDRPGQIGACVESILKNPGDAFELVVVDQSKDDATEGLLSAQAADPRLRYIRSATRGASASRNVGIGSTHAPLLAFTDDDCRVSEDWIARLMEVFATNPEAGMVFGRVSLPEGSCERGFGADFQPHRRVYENCYPAPDVAWGIGANMAVRRDVFDRIGIFDELLGPGSIFPAAEDTDLTIRALAAGVRVVNADEVSVLHLGVREGRAASFLVRGYGVALGAAFAKHVRLGTRGSFGLLSGWLVLHGTRSIKNALRGRRPFGVGFVVGLLRGVVRSGWHELDRAGRVYEVH
jgi:GT2 family glycosyltransferase